MKISIKKLLYISIKTFIKINIRYMNSIQLKKTDKKDYFRLVINGVDVTGEQEKSTFRHLIEVLDNGVN